MNKKSYITPSIKEYSFDCVCLLSVSPADNMDMNWSGENPGTAGPGDLDDFSTGDSF